MTTVFNVLERPGATKLAGQLVIVELVASLTDEFAPGFVPAEDLAVFSRAIIKTDQDGRWAVDLRPTTFTDNVYSAAGLVYRVTETAAGGESSYYIDVPAEVLDDDDVGIPVWVGDILTVAPANLPTLDADFDAADVPLDTTNFDGNLNVTIDDVQAFADFFDDMDLSTGPGGGSGGHVIVEDALTFTQRPTLRLGTGLAGTDDNVLEETVLAVDVTELDVLTSTDIGSTVAPLVAGLVPTENLPALAINDVFTVPSEAAMLALDATAGDVAIRTDTEQAFILSVLPANELDNWVELALGGSVVSVNGLTGAVVLDAGDITVDESGFGGILDNTITDVQALADAVDAIVLPTEATPSGAAGGQLTGTYPNPSVATSHSGSTHADVQAAAEGTAAAALTAHIADIASAHVAQAVNVDTSGFTGFLAGTTTVQTFAADVDAIVAGNVPLDTSLFVGNLNPSIIDVQSLAEAVDAFTLTSPIESVNGQVGVVVLTAADVGAIDVGQLGVPSGVATLDITGIVDIDQWPAFVSEVNGLTGEVLVTGADIPLAAEGFAGNLDNTITDVQLLAEAVDVLTTSGTSGHTLKQAGTPFTTRAAMNYVSNFKLTDDAGGDETEIRFADDLTLVDGVVTGPTIAGGKIGNATAISLTNSYTVTEDPTDYSIGTPIYINEQVIANYDGGGGGGATGPTPYTLGFGPRGTVHIESQTTYNYDTFLFGLTKIGFVDQSANRNQAGNGMSLTPAWSYVCARAYIADGAAVTQRTNDTTNGPASFIETPVFAAGNSGTYTADSGRGIYGFVSQPAVIGDVQLDHRTGFYCQDMPTTVLGASLEVGFEGQFGGMTFVGQGPGVVDEQRGFYCERLHYGTRNIGIRCDSTIELWADTYTHTTNPLAPILVSGEHTLNVAAGASGFPLLDFTSTFNFPNAASVFGAIGFLSARPTLTTTRTGGEAWSLNQFLYLAPVYSATNVAASAGMLRQIVSFPTLTKTGGSGTLQVDDLQEIALTPAVETGVSLTNRTGIYIADPSGSGTVTNNYGIYIDALVATTTAIGIYNPNDSVMGGTIYGSVVPTVGIRISSNGNRDGVIYLDNPETEFVVTNGTQTSLKNAAFVDATITLDFASATARGFYWGPTIVYEQAGSSIGSMAAFQDGATYRNASGENNGMGVMSSFAANPTLNILAATATTTSYASFNAAPATSRTTSGLLTVTDLFGFRAAPSVGANTTVTTLYGYTSTPTLAASTSTVTTRYGVHIGNPTLNSGTLTTNYGIYVEDQTSGTTAYGIYNAGTSKLVKEINFGLTSTASAVVYHARMDSTVTLDFASAAWNGVRFAGSYRYSQAGAAVSGICFADVNTYKNTATVSASLGIILGLNLGPTLNNETNASPITAAYWGINYAPITSRTTSGSMTTSMIGLRAAPTVGTGTTVDSYTAVAISGASNSGTLTAQTGIDVGAMTAATTNIGIKCAAPIVLVPATATAVAGTAYVSTSPYLRVTTVGAGGVTMTANPQINTTNVTTGQTLIIENGDAADSITWVDGNGTNLDSAVVQGPGDVMYFIFNGTLWLLVARSNN